MKFKIQEYENRSDIVSVTNLSDKAFTYDGITIEEGQTLELSTGLAKVRLGDWEKPDDVLEKVRQSHLNIDHFEFEIGEKEQFQTIKQAVSQQVVEHTDEEEFADLKNLTDEPEKEQQEDVVVNLAEVCAGVTAKGEKCKRPSLDGSGFCPSHKPKEGE